MALIVAGLRWTGARPVFALLATALLACAPAADSERLVLRLLDGVGTAHLALESIEGGVTDLQVIRDGDGPRLRARLRRGGSWARQPEESIFGDRIGDFVVWSFRTALPTSDASTIRLESARRRLEPWRPERKPPPFGWFHSSGGFYPRGFHLVLPAGVTPEELDLVAEFAPSAGLALELAMDGSAPPAPRELVRWAAIGGESRRALFVPGGGEVRFELEVPAGARLRFAAGRREHAWSDPRAPSHLELELRDESGWRTVASLEFPEPVGAPAAWRPVEVPLAADSRGRVELRFRVPDGSSRGALAHFAADPVVVAPGRRDRRPNLVLFVVDGLRADHVGPRDGEPSLTPHLDRLARRGLSFVNASAAATWTRPSVASMFTGRLPSGHGVEGEDEASRLPRSVPTLAETLRGAGWATVALSANPHLDPAFGLSRGFSRVTSSIADGAVLESGLLGALERRDHDPFFLFGFFMDTHYPWTDRAEDPEAETISARVVDAQRLGRSQDRGGPRNPEPSAEEVRKLRALYRENVRYVDARLGAVLRRVEELGLSRDTVVAVVADHGEAFGEHGAFFHGWHVHRELEHVPLILAGPGVPRGVRDDPVSLAHLPALLLELLGIREEPIGGSGVARDLLAGRGEPPPPVIETRFRGSDQAALVAGSWKLILGRRHGAVRLYDLARDPRELDDRSAAEPQRVDRMRAELERRLRAERAVRAEGPGDSESDLEEVREQLRALGYL